MAAKIYFLIGEIIMARHENKLIITYTGMNYEYLDGKVMQIAGRENAGADDLGTIVAPVPAQDVEIDKDAYDPEPGPVPDPVLFSYVNTKGGKVRLRVVLVKIWSKAGLPSTCKVSVYVPSVDGDWISKTEDVTLLYADGSPVRNPHGMVDVGEKVCFIDYENQKIATVTEAALEGAGDDTTLTAETVDLSDYLDTDAKGQAIIALGDKVYALYIRTDLQASYFEYSQLLRLGFDGSGTLDVETQTIVGKNAQSIIPVLWNDVVWLLIPAIGGRQLFTGATTGTDSNICVVEAEAASWPANAVVKITGDPYVTPEPPTPLPDPTAFNIIAVGAAMRGNSSKLFILTQVYTDETADAEWMLYDTTVDDFLGITGTFTLSGAVSADKLTLEDEGMVQAGSAEIPYPNPPPSTYTVYYSTYFWDLVYEQSHRNDENEDRLWIALGSPLLVTKPNKYSSPNKPNGPFIMYYCIGGVNVNSIDLPIETLHQAKREVSLKRGMRGARAATSK
jgi:hypothetical protein